MAILVEKVHSRSGPECDSSTTWSPPAVTKWRFWEDHLCHDHSFRGHRLRQRSRCIHSLPKRWHRLLDHPQTRHDQSLRRFRLQDHHLDCRYPSLPQFHLLQVFFHFYPSPLNHIKYSFHCPYDATKGKSGTFTPCCILRHFTFTSTTWILSESFESHIFSHIISFCRKWSLCRNFYFK